MKNFFLSLLVISVFSVLPSCGNDDEKELKFFTGDCRQLVSLESGPANSPITTAAVISTLDGMLTDSPGYGSPVSSGELQVTGSNTVVKVTGLPPGTALKDFKVNINGIEQEFGEISNERANLNLYTDTYLDFFKQAFGKMVSDRRLETRVSFTPTVKATDSVKLEIVFSGRFSYWAKI